MITDEYILNKYLNIRNQINTIRLKNINDDELKYLLNRFNDDTNHNLNEIIYRIKHKIEEIPKCPICGKLTYYRNSTIGYSLTCSKECNYKLIYQHSKETCLKKYGVDNPAKSEIAKEHYKQTCLEKYGYDNSSKSNIVKEKAKQTCLEKYGKPNVYNYEKAKQTFLKHFGVDHNFKSKENREKAKQTSIQRYGRYNNLDKRNRTNIERYGGKSPMHSDEVKEHFKQSLKNKYGYEHALQNPISYNKMIESKHKHNTWISSTFENLTYQYLLTLFDKNDIYRQYRDIRYKNPITHRRFLTDFYIKSIDLFIEIQGFYSHGNHAFDPNNIDDINELNTLINKTNKNDLFQQKINVWTKSDPLKRQIAKDNNLNFIEAWNLDELKNKLKQYINEI